jgi:hypothetical protein
VCVCARRPLLCLRAVSRTAAVLRRCVPLPLPSTRRARYVYVRMCHAFYAFMHMYVCTHTHNTWQMAMGSTTVDIVQLLGCCVCACERAATVIRAVESKRRSATTGSIEGAVLKVATDSRSYLTEADTAAQKIIMQTLRGEVCLPRHLCMYVYTHVYDMYACTHTHTHTHTTTHNHIHICIHIFIHICI